MTTLDLKDPDSGKEWRLYNIQISDDPTRGSPDVYSAPGQSSDQTFISLLTEQEQFKLTGLVTAPRLSGQTSPNAYSSDWRDALSEYIQRGEAFAHSSQHTGYTLEERDRSRTTLNVVIEDFQWTYEHGAINQLSYQLTLRRGNGLLPDDSIVVGECGSNNDEVCTTGTETNAPTLDSESLKGFQTLEGVKSLGDLNVAEVAFGGNAGANQIAATQGATRKWTFRGIYPGSNSARNSFDDTIRGKIDNSTHTFTTIFPGYSPSVKVLSFDSNRKWEHGESHHEYEIELQEAQ